MRQLVKLIHGIYKTTISPFLRLVFIGGCRFTPTCSDYAKEAILKYGIVKGTALAALRISRCHAFNHASTFDPVV